MGIIKRKKHGKICAALYTVYVRYERRIIDKAACSRVNLIYVLQIEL
jgi:hypothetical protein